MDYQLDYDHIDEVLQAIPGGIGDIEKILENVRNVISELPEIWTGTDAQEYINKINEYIPKIYQLRNYYNAAQEVLQKSKQEHEEGAQARLNEAHQRLDQVM